MCGVIAVIRMGMIVNAAGTIVQQMGGNDEDHGKGQDPELISMPYLLGYQKNNTCCKEGPGHQAMMMLLVAMP